MLVGALGCLCGPWGACGVHRAFVRVTGVLISAHGVTGVLVGSLGAHEVLVGSLGFS